MRRILGIFSLLLLPATAFAQGANTAIVGFGGLTMNGYNSSSTSLGGSVAYNLIPGMQVVGEVGHLGNVMPTLADTLYSVAGAGLNVSAFYGEGGVRILAPRTAFAPYAEATAGYAKLDLSSPYLSGLGGLAGVAANIGLGFVDRTTPIASVGGGLFAHSGPVVFDVGYRYKQLFANDVLQGVLGLGQPLHTHEVRFGVGVRF